MNFNYQLGKEKGINVLTLSGELIDKAQALEMTQKVNSLIEAEDSRFILRMDELKYVNSSGLSILINILTRARKAGGDVAIAGVSKKVNELLIITRLNNIFNMNESLENAVESMLNK